MTAAVLDGECGERSRLAGVPCEEHFHRSLMLLYSNLNPKFTPGGATAHFLWGKADTCNRFVDGTDIESWKRLANLMVANGGRNVQMS
jgi:hypothetical protein